MQVLKPDIDLADGPDADEIAGAVAEHFEAFDLDPATDEVALAFDFDLAARIRQHPRPRRRHRRGAWRRASRAATRST